MAYWRYVEPKTTQPCAKRQAEHARGIAGLALSPGRNLRFLHLPPFALCLRYFANTGRTARSRIPFIFAIAIP